MPIVSEAGTMNSATPSPEAAARRFLTGLLGAPIAHSASPAMHERAAAALGLHCHYQLIEVAGAGREELKVLLEGVRRLGFAGINVTFPYKEAVVDLLDELSPRAALIGAVNTVVVRDSRLIGHNTDATGFARAIAELVTASSHGAVAVIGAGGVGKAIAFALAGPGVRRITDFRQRPRQGRSAGRPARWPGDSAALPIASRMRCAASRAWSTLPRSGCCPASIRRFPKPCCMPGFGSPMPCIRRSGRRC